MEYRTLRNGVKIPVIGFGVFQIPAAQTKQAVLSALRAGYRLIDTARAYGNEREVGEAIRESGIPREEIFVTTKLWLSDFSYDGAIQATQTSLERLGVDTIDLMLLHQPMGDYQSAWKALEKLYKDGTLRAIGMATATRTSLPTSAKRSRSRPWSTRSRYTPSSNRSATWKS